MTLFAGKTKRYFLAGGVRPLHGRQTRPAVGGGRSAVVVVFLLVVAVLGCGKKTLPLPPASVVPEPIRDLSYRLNEGGVILSWTMPGRTVQNEKLERVESFLIYRSVAPASQDCSECPIAFGQPIEIEGGHTAVPGGSLARGSFTETLLRPEHRYFYMVRSKGGWHYMSQDSNIVSFFWDTPPAAPQHLSVVGGDHKAVLAWQPVVRLLDGREITDGVAYQLYRRREDTPFLPLGGPLSATDFTDYGVENGHRYFYTARAVRKYKELPIAGMPSSEVVVLPRDLTPPLPPREIDVKKTGEGITLSWPRVPEADLAGFRIYRRVQTSDKSEFIGTVPAATLSFTDSTIHRESDIVYYSVSAFDSQEPPNESIPSPEAHVRIGNGGEK